MTDHRTDTVADLQTLLRPGILVMIVVIRPTIDIIHLLRVQDDMGTITETTGNHSLDTMSDPTISGHHTRARLGILAVMIAVMTINTGHPHRLTEMTDIHTLDIMSDPTISSHHTQARLGILVMITVVIIDTGHPHRLHLRETKGTSISTTNQRDVARETTDS